MRKEHIVCGVLLAVLAGVAAEAAESDDDGGHLKIEEPARISDAELTQIYRELQDRMVDGYALSQYPVAGGYTKWQLYNTAPYLSATHGNRYINNYGNAQARGYDRLNKGGKMQIGAALAKDSFTVTADGKVFPGALFLMEKLAAGVSPASGDWRYVMIMPDGSLFGDSMGDGADEMGFCHDCHKIKTRQDFLFFVPKKYRRSIVE